MKRSVFRAMGTLVDVTAPTAAGVDATRRLFEDVEQRASRFLAGSELSVINDDQRTRVPVSPDMAVVLEFAEHARAITDGLVDVGVGGAVRAWGYDRTFDEVVDSDGTAEPMVHDEPNWSMHGANLVRTPGTTIDLGGIAKGWTCDVAVERGLATVVSAGGDVRSVDPDTRVEIIDPWNDVAVTIRLGAGALATSSVAHRRWRFAGRDVNHLIDPRTMRPAESPVLMASAVTDTAAEAEAAAKAILLLGVEGIAWADRQPWVRSALVIWNDGNVYATTGLEVAA